MSVSKHLSRKLRDFIKKLAYVMSKQEEDDLIKAELKLFQSDVRSSKNPNLMLQLYNKYVSNLIAESDTFQNLLRLLFATIVGCEVELGCIYAISCTQSKSLKVKKLAYLCSSLMLSQQPQLNILLVASFQRDLASKSIHDLVIVLGSVNKFLNEIVFQSCLPHFNALLIHQNDLVRKKAYLIFHKAWRDIKKVPVEQFSALCLKAIRDTEFSVRQIGLAMLQDLLRSGTILKEAVQPLCDLHESLVFRNSYPKYAYHQMPNPWAQIRILRCVALLAKGGCVVPDRMFQLVIQSAKKAERYSLGSIQHSIMLQCCKALAQLPPNSYALSLLSEQLAKLFAKPNNNYLSTGMQTLKHLAQLDTGILTLHQSIIVDCIQSEDLNLRQSAVLLMMEFSTSENLNLVVQLCYGIAAATRDSEAQFAILTKAFQLLQKLSPDPLYYVQQTNKFMRLGYKLLRPGILSQYITIIQQNLATNDQAFAEKLLQQSINLVESEPNNQVIRELGLNMILSVSDYYPQLVEQKNRNLITLLSGSQSKGTAELLLLNRLRAFDLVQASQSSPNFINFLESHQFLMPSQEEIDNAPYDLSFLKVEGKRMPRPKVKHATKVVHLVTKPYQTLEKELQIKGPAWTADGYRQAVQAEASSLDLSQTVQQIQKQRLFKGPRSKRQEQQIKQQSKLQKAKKLFGHLRSK